MSKGQLYVEIPVRGEYESKKDWLDACKNYTIVYLDTGTLQGGCMAGSHQCHPVVWGHYINAKLNGYYVNRTIPPQWKPITKYDLLEYMYLEYKSPLFDKILNGSYKRI